MKRVTSFEFFVTDLYAESYREKGNYTNAETIDRESRNRKEMSTRLLDLISDVDNPKTGKSISGRKMLILRVYLYCGLGEYMLYVWNQNLTGSKE